MTYGHIDPYKSTEVGQEVWFERGRQDARWGEQNHPDGTDDGEIQRALRDFTRRECDRLARVGGLTWKHILGEEVQEAFAESDPARLREELIQVAAVACAWVEAIDRRETG